jgi:cytochrome c peroxidase
MNAEAPDLGRYTVTGVERDKGAFKTPTLRDVAPRPPYMHDGSLATLCELAERHPRRGQARLSAAERSDLVAFLETLTAPGPRAEEPAGACR